MGSHGHYGTRSRIGLRLGADHSVLEGDEWVLNGEKIFVTCADRAEIVVVWANIEPSAGKAGVKIVRDRKRHAGIQTRTSRTQIGYQGVGHRDLRFEGRSRAQGKPAGKRRNKEERELRRSDANLRQYPANSGYHGSRRCAGRSRFHQGENRGMRIQVGLQPQHQQYERCRKRVLHDGGQHSRHTATDLAGGIPRRRQNPQQSSGVNVQSESRLSRLSRDADSPKIL